MVIIDFCGFKPTGGPGLQFFARALTKNSQLRPISGVLSANSTEGRGDILLAAINICRWAVTLYRDNVLPFMAHALSQPLRKPSPFAELIGDSSASTEVVIRATHVHKAFKTTAGDFYGRLRPLYQHLQASPPANGISIFSARVNGVPISFSHNPPAVATHEVVDVEIHTRPVGASPTLSTAAELLVCFKCVLEFLRDLHAAGFCHRDLRQDNIIRCGSTFRVIDMEMAARIDRPVFWDSTSLPADIKDRGFRADDDLWQLGRMILNVDPPRPDPRVAAIHSLAERLVQRNLVTADEALATLAEIEN